MQDPLGVLNTSDAAPEAHAATTNQPHTSLEAGSKHVPCSRPDGDARESRPVETQEKEANSNKFRLLHDEEIPLNQSTSKSIAPPKDGKHVHLSMNSRLLYNASQPTSAKYSSLGRPNDISFVCAVPSTSTKTDERGKMFTVYNIKLSALGTRWVVSKRFSELEYLNDALCKRFPNARLPKFPSKGGLGGLFRRLDDATIEKRRADIQTYLDGALSNQAVYKSMLVRMFFEIPRGIEKANREAAEQAAARSAARMKRETKPMNANCDNSNEREIRMKDGRANRAGNSSLRSSILFGSQKRRQSESVLANFDSIRQAIKDGDLITVKQILALDDRLGRYVDPSGQSMLHLACMFCHSDIAMALVDVGADPGLGNAQGETAYDLAPPALAQKMAMFIDSWEEEDSSDSSAPEEGEETGE